MKEGGERERERKKVARTYETHVIKSKKKNTITSANMVGHEPDWFIVCGKNNGHGARNNGRNGRQKVNNMQEGKEKQRRTKLLSHPSPSFPGP